MLLLIDTDRNKTTGWEGYDLTVDPRSSSHWKVDGNRLELAIEREKFADSLDFEFKWVDNLNSPGDIMDFYTCGDAAPGGRFNYRFCE